MNRPYSIQVRWVMKDGSEPSGHLADSNLADQFEWRTMANQYQYAEREKRDAQLERFAATKRNHKRYAVRFQYRTINLNTEAVGEMI